MSPENHPVYQSTFALLVRVSNLSIVLQDEEGRGRDFERLREELVEVMTCVCRAGEAGEDADLPVGIAAEHMMRSKIWIRVLMETRVISRYIYQQLYSAASSIQKQLLEWREEI